MRLTTVDAATSTPAGMWWRGKLLGQHRTADESPDFAPETTASWFLWSHRGGSVAMAFVVGTGGVWTADYVADRDARGYRFLDFEYRDRAAPVAAGSAIRAPTQSLARVRDVLSPSVTELASLLGVSRQAIYNWQSGQPIAEQNEARLEQLAQAADLLASEGLKDKPSAMRRKLPGGKTFFEIVREGKPAADAAAMLVALLKLESAQREAVASRLAARARKPVDVSEIGSPHLDDRP